MNIWKAIGVSGILLVVYAQIGWRAQAGDTCTGVVDDSIGSPSRTYRVHVMSQYCAPGFGLSSNPYWVVVGDDVARTGETNYATLAEEDEVAFKTFNFAPTVSWKDTNHLVIELHHVTTVAKSLHAVGDVHVTYKLAENLSEANYLREQQEYEATSLSEIKSHKATFVGDPVEDVEFLEKLMSENLKAYRTFQAWFQSNAD